MMIRGNNPDRPTPESLFMCGRHLKIFRRGHLCQADKPPLSFRLV